MNKLWLVEFFWGGEMDEFGEVGQWMNAKKLNNRKESENG
jgi:hypothetical protein